MFEYYFGLSLYSSTSPPPFFFTRYSVVAMGWIINVSISKVEYLVLAGVRKTIFLSFFGDAFTPIRFSKEQELQ